MISVNLISGPLAAVEQRVPEYRDLTFMRQGGPIEIDLRLRFSSPQQAQLGQLNYRLVLAADQQQGVRISEELLKRVDSGEMENSETRLLGKTSSGADFYRRESSTYQDSFQFGPSNLALSHTPPDIQKYPTGNAVKNFLEQGVRFVQLNSTAMRQPAAATRPTRLDLDGTNLPRVVGALLKGGPASLSTEESGSAIVRWTNHLRLALEDLRSIGWAARAPDNAEYLTLHFNGGLECPSWLLSDGTLRMLALTLLAFLPSSPSLYMIEEPENGVHPQAIEIIIKALAAIPEAQVFVATHSPIVVQQVGAKLLLCFQRDDNLGVQITPGERHPALKGWTGTPDIGSIFSSRVLG